MTITFSQALRLLFNSSFKIIKTSYSRGGKNHEPQMLLLLAGLALVIVGIIGGGLKVKEISVPQIGKIARTAALVIGIVLVLMSVTMMIDGEGEESEGVGDMDYQTETEYQEPQDSGGYDAQTEQEDYDSQESSEDENQNEF